MIKLANYLKSIPMAERSDFAARCGTSFEYLRQIAYGNRICREATAINIERESGSAITCEDLRKDVDWAFIRASGPAKEAP